MQGTKERCYRDPESRKGNIRKILNQKDNM